MIRPAPTIRACRATDIEQIAAIYAHHVQHGDASFEIEPPDAEEMRRRHADIVAKRFPYLVADDAGTVRGYGYVGPYRPRAAYRDTVENSVYLRPDSIGRGIGAMLLGALIAECEALGLRQMVAVVGDGANAASIRLHERLGFRHVGVLRAVGYKHGRWLDSVLLQRALGAGDSTQPVPR